MKTRVFGLMSMVELPLIASLTMEMKCNRGVKNISVRKIRNMCLAIKLGA